MENKITKNLIILGAIIFSFFALTNSVSAYTTYAFSNDPINYDSASAYAGNQGYSQYNYYQSSGYIPMTPQIMNPINPVNPYNTNQGYPQTAQVYPQYSYYQASGYNTSTQPQPQPKTTSVVNNYYQTAPATTAKTTTSTTTDTTNKNTTTNNTDTTGTNTVGYNNSLGASAYNGSSQASGNGLTALSLAGSGGFMPSSIWQWIFVIILILVIVIISRMLINNRQTVLQESHIVHAH